MKKIISPVCLTVFPHHCIVSAFQDAAVSAGIEATDDRPVLTVQWHPEDCCVEYPAFQQLFGWFVNCSGYTGSQ